MDNTLGAIELGTLVSAMLYGMATTQTFSYFDNGKTDSRWLRSFVATVWLLETIHTAFSWIYVYTLTVKDYGNPGALSRVQWSFAACVVMHDVLSSAVQSFYAYRIYILSRQLAFAVIQWVGSMLRVALIFALLGYAVNAPTLDALVTRHKRLAIATVASSASVDILNTAMLCFHLIKHRRTGTRQTGRTIDKIIIWAVETGLLTSLCATTILVIMLVLPRSGIWEGLMMIYARLYSNSLLVSLNSRGAIRRGTEQDGPVVIGISGFSAGVEKRKSRPTESKSTGVSVTGCDRPQCAKALCSQPSTSTMNMHAVLDIRNEKAYVEHELCEPAKTSEEPTCTVEDSV
ncbi:hypothetical protein OBBRIDRAFT_436750 [Obba rivulosa]|uniref:DUF6534 domain-containing protein n=1 Tax=Obba rivulosa TaxID=1052685 RepID=A0A8E2DMR6_9APHY|nr:hypothetical protein OBBRIDRAFT_436750 [Obba rivulosa]